MDLVVDGEYADGGRLASPNVGNADAGIAEKWDMLWMKSLTMYPMGP